MVEYETKIVEEAIKALDKYYDQYNKSRNGISLIEASTLMRTLLPADHPYRKRSLISEYEATKLAEFTKEITAPNRRKKPDEIAAEPLW